MFNEDINAFINSNAITPVTLIDLNSKARLEHNSDAHLFNGTATDRTSSSDSATRSAH